MLEFLSRIFSSTLDIQEMTSATNIDTSLYLRIKKAMKNASDAEISRRLKISNQAVSLWKKGETKPDASKLIRVAEISGVPLEWLLTGDVNQLRRALEKQSYDNLTKDFVSSLLDASEDRTEEISTAEIADALIIENLAGQLKGEELQAIRALAKEKGGDIASVMYSLLREALVSRGLLQEPKDIEVHLIELNLNPRQQISVALKGEILPEHSINLFESPPTVQIPASYKKRLFEGKDFNLSHIFCFVIRTADLNEEGLYIGDMVVCASISAFGSAEGQPMVVIFDKGRKGMVRRFYLDPLVHNQAAFAPIRGNRPIIRLKTTQYELIGAVLGIERLAPRNEQ